MIYLVLINTIPEVIQFTLLQVFKSHQLSHIKMVNKYEKSYYLY